MYDNVGYSVVNYTEQKMCRSFLSAWKNDNGEEVYDGRCNMGVVSINLPRVALDTVAEYKRLRALKGKRIFDLTNDKIVLDAQEKEELRLLQQDYDWWVNFRDHETFTLFLKLLDKRLELCHKALQTRIKRLEIVTAKVAPICWQYGALGRLQPNDHIINLLKNGYASISLGYVGLSECISCLFGKYDGINHEYGRTRALDILKALKDKCDKWKAEEGYGYSVYGTPAENLAGRFERLDREKYGIVKDVTDKDYYTNSFHLDVQQKVDPFAKIDYESNFLPYTSGGMINYVELPNMSHNLQALEDIINYAYNKVGYFGINSPIDVCSCGWHGESEFKDGHFICPNCGTHDPSKLHCIRRVCGYLGEVNQRPVNTGKIDEFTKRVKHV